MKKALIISAIAATVAAPAFAQSSVTLYGRLNVTVESQKVGTTTNKGVFNNASRFGFKGTEDLGGGLKAGFQLESGFNPANGQAAGSFWGRQAEVNLGGAFGTVRLGQFTPESYFATADYVSMHNHDTGDSSDNLYASKFISSGKVAYRTPAMGGMTAEIATADAKYTGNVRPYDLAINYDAGALHLGLGADKVGSAKQVAVRALYELGALTVGGYVQRDTNESLGLTGSRNNFRLSGMYAMGATELHLNVGKSGNVGSNANTGAKQFTVGVNQNLSKRTKVYAYYSKTDNSAAASYGSGVVGADLSAIAVGVRHNF